jgi:hypothetical protein
MLEIFFSFVLPLQKQKRVECIVSSAAGEKYHMRLYSRAQFGDLQELRKGGNPLYLEVIKTIKAACFSLPSSIFLIQFFHFHLVPERSSEGVVGLKRKSSVPNPAAPFLLSLSTFVYGKPTSKSLVVNRKTR